MPTTNNIHDFDITGLEVGAGLALAERSCSLLKVDPQVLQRHPVIGMRAAFASLIRDGLNDNPNSPPQSRHRRFATGPLFLTSYSSKLQRRENKSHSGRDAQSGTLVSAYRS